MEPEAGGGSGAVTRRFLVSGRVQGVGYRWFAAKTARALGLSGFARNLADGRVEIEARGSAEALEQMERELAVGPAGASVRRIEATDAREEVAVSEKLVETDGQKRFRIL